MTPPDPLRGGEGEGRRERKEDECSNFFQALQRPGTWRYNLVSWLFSMCSLSAFIFSFISLQGLLEKKVFPTLPNLRRKYQSHLPPKKSNPRSGLLRMLQQRRFSQLSGDSWQGRNCVNWELSGKIMKNRWNVLNVRYYAVCWWDCFTQFGDSVGCM